LDSGLPCFPQEYRVPWYSRSPTRVSIPFVYGAVTLSGRPFQIVLLETRFVTRLPSCNFACWALQPQRRIGLQTTKRRWFGLLPFRSPLLRECFSLPRGTKMFQFPRFPPPGLCIQPGVPRFFLGGFPHSGISGYSACTRAPQSLSQCATPFFGF
jgi:hypothetical protein